MFRSRNSPPNTSPQYLFNIPLRVFFSFKLRLRRFRSFRCFKVAIPRQIPRLLFFQHTWQEFFFFGQIMPAKKHCNSRSRENKLTMHDVDLENWMRLAFADCFVLTGSNNGYLLLLLHDRNPALMTS